jgi:hypothetical protein
MSWLNSFWKYRRKLPDAPDKDNYILPIKLPDGTEVTFTEIDGITPIDVETFRMGEDLFIKLPLSGGYIYYGH